MLERNTNRFRVRERNVKMLNVRERNRFFCSKYINFFTRELSVIHAALVTDNEKSS